MTTLAHHLTYGPYKGTVEVDLVNYVCRGKVLFIDDVVTYEADSLPELQGQFEAAVDDYINTCVEIGKDPQPREQRLQKVFDMMDEAQKDPVHQCRLFFTRISGRLAGITRTEWCCIIFLCFLACFAVSVVTFELSAKQKCQTANYIHAGAGLTKCDKPVTVDVQP